MGHRFTKDEIAEGHAAAGLGQKSRLSYSRALISCSTVCALDGGKIDSCLVNNYFLKLLIRTKGKQDLGSLT